MSDALDINPEVLRTWTNMSEEDQQFLFENFTVIRELLKIGIDGTFTTADAKTVTVTKGIITEIV